MQFNSLWESTYNWFLAEGIRLVIILVLTTIALIVAKLIAKRIVTFYKAKHQDRELQKRADTLGSMFRYVLSASIIIVAIMQILELFGMELGPMLAAAGVAGIAIGFGAQHLVKDITNGFFIMIDDEIREGDVVRVVNVSGVVEHVGLRQVVLRDLEGNVHFIPNSHIDVVTNMTKTFSFCVLNIGVAYREDVDEVFEIIENIINNLKVEEPYSEWIQEEVEILGLDEFANSAMIIKARVKVEPIRQWKIKREFNRRIKKIFDERNIEIPFPHMTIYPGQDKKGIAPSFSYNTNYIKK